MRRLPLAAAKRAAALALALAFAAGLYGALVHPLVRLNRDYDERIAALRKSLAVHERVAAGRAEAERRLEALRRADASRPYYLAQASPALAAAELQGLVKRALAQAGGELISTQVLASPRSAHAREIVVGARARGDVHALARTLHALESGLPLVFVERLSVDVQPDGSLLFAFDASAHASATPASPGRAPTPARALFPFGELAEYAGVAERTLFDRSRRAPAQAVLAAGTAPPPPAAVSLAGLLVREKRKVALVQRAGTAELIGLEPGDLLDGWELVDVRVDRIVLRRGGHSREMFLRE